MNIFNYLNTCINNLPASLNQEKLKAIMSIPLTKSNLENILTQLSKIALTTAHNNYHLLTNISITLYWSLRSIQDISTQDMAYHNIQSLIPLIHEDVQYLEIF